MNAQKVEVREAELIYLPGVADSNSPMHWNRGKLYVYNSDGNPLRSEGTSLTSLRNVRSAHIVHGPVSPWWIEATFRDPDGTIFAWYHHETWDVCESETTGVYLSVPVIGALISKDNGRTFKNLGFILQARGEPNCKAENGYFAGGHGDFSVILDRERKFFYFLFSNYSGEPTEQGVAIARMPYEHRYDQVGSVFKYRDGEWESPGVEGAVTPIFAVKTPWERPNTDALWDPSIHYNRELGEHVILLNHACCEPGWPAAGIFVSTNPDLSNPKGWSEPERIVQGGGWYPMTVGLDPGDTDKEAGAKARLFMGSDSFWEIYFRKGQTGVTEIRASAPNKK